MKKNIRGKHLIVHIILPVNLVLCLALLVSQFVFLQTTVEKEGLSARRFLYESIRHAIEGREEQIPRWIRFIALGNGKLLYAQRQGERLQEKFQAVRSRIMGISDWIRYLVQDTGDNESYLSFRYKGVKGICMYNNEDLPAYLRLVYDPLYLGIFVFVVTLSFSFGVLLMNSHLKNIRVLVKATKRLKAGDFETPVTGAPDGEMFPVYEALEEMRRELLELRRRGILMITGITHDLKTPLTSMRMYVEAVKDGVIQGEDEVREALGKSLEKSALLEDRIREMLEVVKSKNLYQHKGEAVDVLVWLKDMSDLFRDECRLYRRNYEEHIQVKEKLRVSGNPGSLGRILNNLLDNAIRYTEEGDSIRFTARRDLEKRELLLLLEDSGPGVLPEDRDKIFDLFFRKDKGRNTRGMGIGLAAVKFMTEMLGGSVGCKASSLGGAGFEIRLPLEGESDPDSAPEGS